MNQIRDWLWITDIGCIREREVPTDVVITVCQDSVRENVGCRYHHFEMSDGPHNPYGGRYDYPYWEYAANTVFREWMQSRDLTVHCHVGRSRSASICIGVLGRVEQIPFEEARAQVESARPVINPDPLLAEHAEDYIEKYT